MKRILIFTCALLLSLSLSAQENTIRLTVSGEGATKEDATANALRSVTVQVRINTDGSLTAKVIRGCDPSLDKEALRVISQSPKLEPGKQNGQTVPVVFTYSVPFQLR